MKQKNFLLTGGFALAVAIAAKSYDAYTSIFPAGKAELLMANVEALAEKSEISNGNTVDCYSSTKAKKGATCYDCGPCKHIYNSTGTGPTRTCITSEE